VTFTKENSPFFVVGSSRSGTTLLRLILAGHSRITIPPETWFILPLVERFPLRGSLTREQTTAAVKVITECHRWLDMDMPSAELAAQVSTLYQPSLSDLINVVYRYHLDRSGKQRAGDKTPPYINIMAQLKTLYPAAKFVNLVRDGRDVAISFVDAHFKGRPYHGSEFEWTKAIRQGMSCRNTYLANDVLDVRYEELVTDVEGTTRRVCSFLGEEFEPAMLQFQDRMMLVPGREWDIHRKLDKPIPPDATAVWRRKLSAVECFVIEASLRRELVKLGYPLRFSSAVWRPLMTATAAVMRALAPVLDIGIPALRRRGIIARHGYI
jgi:Sulfotransferase family